MSEQPSETPSTDPAQGEEAQEQPTPEVDWKAKAREWERRAKENKSAADDLAAIRESQKTEAQKAADRLADAERKATDAEARAVRRDVALDFKLSKDDAALLDSVIDEDAMRALAGRLATKSEDERKKTGNRDPLAGRTATNPASDDLATVRGLFGSGD
jgi:hypothetical protein